MNSEHNQYREWMDLYILKILDLESVRSTDVKFLINVGINRLFYVALPSTLILITLGRLQLRDLRVADIAEVLGDLV
jgi:hypothetical protein